MNVIRLIAITLPMMLLIACGGGGGGTSGSSVITPAQISSALREIAGQEDDVLTLDEEMALETRGQFLPLRNATIEFDGTDNGMNLFTFYGISSEGPPVLRYTNFGGWDGNVVFGYQVLFQEGDEYNTITASNYYVYGEPSASRPQGTGRAVWRGASIGHHSVDEGGEDTETSWRGDVVLDIDDLANPDIDITVSGLESIVPDSTYPALVNATASAENIPLMDDGTFTRTGDDEEWRGGFYGENHSHVGGVFRQGDLEGAFGAKR